ncbi:hypothetical protein GGF32_008055 [Allomyces javanicus]|nr:hypothetical protein GGF32_008055 [Allomyces javanicus]
MNDPNPLWAGRDMFRPIFAMIPATLTTRILELHKYSAFVTGNLVVPPRAQMLHLVPILKKDDAISIASRVPATIESLKLACPVSATLVEKLAAGPKPNLELLDLNGIYGADAALIAALSRVLHLQVRALMLTFARGGERRNGAA